MPSFRSIATLRTAPVESILLPAVVLLGFTGGCSSGHATIAPVSGVVRVNGKPIAAGQVTFWPTAGRSASGSIGADGSYTLTTYRDGDGATVGSNRVTITSPAAAAGPPDVESDQPNRAGAASPVPATYANPDSSGLTFDVQRGANRAEFDLTSK